MCLKKRNIISYFLVAYPCCSIQYNECCNRSTQHLYSSRVKTTTRAYYIVCINRDFYDVSVISLLLMLLALRVPNLFVQLSDG
jgi:hypothetical protein